MSLAWEPKLWETRFGKFVHQYGVDNLAGELGYHRSAIYHWIKGIVVPLPETAEKIVELGRCSDGRRRVTLEDVFAQRKAALRILKERETRGTTTGKEK